MSTSSPQPSAAPSPAPSASAGTDGSAANAATLYDRISADTELTQSLFRQALQDPAGALDRIVALGQQLGLPVSREEVRAHVASLEDPASKQWLVKARGGL